MRRWLSTMLEMIWRALAAMLLLWSFAAPVGATALEDANAAAESGDYAKAMQLLRPLAEQGDAAAQYDLGIMYYAGQGVARNAAEAVRWFGKAAEQGDLNAQYN